MYLLGFQTVNILSFARMNVNTFKNVNVEKICFVKGS